MKNSLLPLLCGAAALTTIAFWNSDATAQPAPVASTGIKLPLNRNCTITVDARSNARSSMTQQMQRLSGFVRQETVQGTLIAADATWLVLKDDKSENWVPRDKVLMLRVSSQ